MAKIVRFEDIETWQRARELTRIVYQVTQVSHFSRDFGLKDQIRRASMSIMSNITEGFERDGDKEFQQHLAVAKGSVGEVKAQLYVALDAGLISDDQFHNTYRIADEVARLIAGFMRYLKNSPFRRSKYKQ